MAIDTTAARSRRALLTAGLAAAAAAVASALGRPSTAIAANGDPLLVGQSTAATTETVLTQPTDGVNGLRVSGSATANAIQGDSPFGCGVFGRSVLAGVGVSGASDSQGAGIIGTAGSWPGPMPVGFGVYAWGPTGVRADGAAGIGVDATGTTIGAKAVASSNGPGLLAASGGAAVTPGTKVGVQGYANQDANARGVLGSSPLGTGVYGESTSGIGLRGVSSSNTGLRGDSTTGTAVRAFSTGGRAVNATAGSTTAAAITSQMTSTKSAVQGFTGPGAVPAPSDETGVEGRCDISYYSNGVYGQSATGNGVFGSSDSGYGVLGLGYYGLWGSGAAGVVGDVDGGTGVQGWTGNAFAPDPVAHVGVWAGAEDGRTAFQVVGVAKFNRSGRVSFSSGQSSKKIAVPGGITASSFAVATLQTNRTGVYVQAVVPSATDSSITIYLNKAVTATTACGWIVMS